MSGLDYDYMDELEAKLKTMPKDHEDYEYYKDELDTQKDLHEQTEFWYRVWLGEIVQYGEDDGSVSWEEKIYTDSKTGQKFKMVCDKVVFVTEEDSPYEPAIESVISKEGEE
tara:strand:+ start:801 stop:1136 length:336 start_codon:yes stop_codon:yes gene_type:complete